MSLQYLVRSSQIKKNSLFDYAHINKVSKNDDRLRYLRPFYNGAFCIASNNDIDAQNLLLATICT
jgi:hypothetical protein